MKKKQLLKQSILMMLVVSISPAVWAQSKQLLKSDFVVLKTGSIPFKPYTIKDLTADPKKSGDDLITLPNKKQVKISDYLNTINTVEKNLADIGYDAKQIKGTIVIAEYKPKLPVLIPQLPANNLQILSKPVIQQRFNTTGVSSNLVILTKNVGRLVTKTTQQISHSETPTPFDFTVGDYKIKLAPSFTMTGKTDPIDFTNDNQRNMDTLTAFVKNKNNQYSLGFNVDMTTNIPMLGNVSVYNLQSNFQARSNKDSSQKSNVQLKVFEQVLISENKKINSDHYSFSQDRDYNINKLIGSADIFNFALNLLSPVNFYLTGTVGGSINVDVSRTGITGEMGPTFGQSIILESSIYDATGASILQNNVLDAGVGGELKLVEGTLDFGGSTGITAASKKIKLLNDVYSSFNLAFLQGRLYTYVSYPAYLCGTSLLGLGDPNCWGIRRVENNIFNTGSALQFQFSLADDNQNVDLNW